VQNQKKLCGVGGVSDGHGDGRGRRGPRDRRVERGQPNAYAADAHDGHSAAAACLFLAG
jgi:hypothetical protein